MPARPPVLTSPRRSETHRKREIDRRRPSAAKRGYDRDWIQLRDAKLAADPLCQCDECKASGRTVAADTVDHIISIEERPDLRLAWSNLRSMAKRHHDRRTARDQGFGRGRKR